LGRIAARAGPVLDNDWLVELVRQPLTDQARNDVKSTAGRKADDDAYRPRRIGLCQSEAGRDREHGSARGQLQKLPTGEFHIALPASSRNSRLDAQ
jgi:hypothetical protein